MKNLLKNLDLSVISIHRQTIEDATAICCDNCGKTIINFAKVTDGSKIYSIGLDCKKSLIDKKTIENMDEYEAKIYKKDLNEINKFLLESSRPNTEIIIDYRNNFLSVNNTEMENDFGMKGKITYFQNLGFLQKHGLTDYINAINK